MFVYTSKSSISKALKKSFNLWLSGLQISLATQIVRVNQNFEVLNDGASPVTEFIFCSTQDQAAHLAFEEVRDPAHIFIVWLSGEDSQAYLT